MTVIAWDGKILAADKQATYGDLIRKSTKIFDLGSDEYLALCGTIGNGLTLLDWYKQGAEIEKWPKELQNGDDWCQLIIASKNGVKYTDRQPYFQKLEDPFMAWGRGCEVAVGALAMGADAIKAVEIAIQFCEGCGCGIDSYKVR